MNIMKTRAAAATIVWGFFSSISTAIAGLPECSLFLDGFEGRTWHVDVGAPGGGDGRSWPLALNDLQDALALAQISDQIWVAGGTYKPVQPASASVSPAERAVSFQLVSGIDLLGGFATDACRGASRNGPASILSGDLLSDDSDSDADGITDTGLEDNSHHVLTADDVINTQIDGFLVRGGVTEGANNRSGGGLFQEGGALTLSNVEFNNNHTGAIGSGAGFASEDGDVRMDSVRFDSNNASVSGGGLWVQGAANVELREVVFENNRSTSNGGGAFLRGDINATLQDTVFEQNQVATGSGGNGNGGGLSIDGGITTLSRTRFLDNIASKTGGALNVRTGRVVIGNSIFAGNVSSGDGGGLFVGSQGPEVTAAYTLFADNSAVNGGGIYTRRTVRLTHVTIVDNAASSSGGALFVLDGNLHALNSIIWANTASTSFPGARTNANTSFARSILQDSGGSPWANAVAGKGLDGAGVLDTDPMFLDELDLDGADDVLGSADDGWSLMPGSPGRDLGTEADLADFDLDGSRREALPDAADADDDGNVTEAAPIDLAGQARKSGHRVDLGAYEHQSGGAVAPDVIYVDASAAGGGNGASWASAFDDLQDALASARGGDQIWVAAGSYEPGTDRVDTFTLRPDVRIYGGFAGTENSLGQRNADPMTNGTILSGDILTADVTDNSMHVVTAGGVGPAASLDGFTISDGYDRQGGSSGWGAGIYNVGGAASFTRLLVTQNEALSGGGVYNRAGAQPRFVDSKFIDNIGWQGGAMHNRESQPEIIGAHFLGNDGGSSGGGIHNDLRSHLKISHSLFEANESLRSLSSLGSAGAGILNTGTGTKLEAHQVVFAGNHALNGGAIGNFNDATAKLSHVTLFDNRAVRGGAMSAFNGSDVFVTNAILWDNKLDTTSRPGNEEAEELYAASSTSTGGNFYLMNTIIDGGTSGPHIFVCGTCSVNDEGANGSGDPQFENSADVDGIDDVFGTPDDGLTPSVGSSAIDAGTFVDVNDLDGDGNVAEALPDFTDVDGDGNYAEPIGIDAGGSARVMGSETDIGAYEFDPS